MQDKHTFHRLALAPFVKTEAELLALWSKLPTEQEANFVIFLQEQGLAPLWDATPACTSLPLNKESRNQLHQARLANAALYLLQRHSLEKIRRTLDAADIPHVITKGCHTREVYYTEANLRPAIDIDILVTPEHKFETIRAFQTEGFTFHATAENAAQDCSLIKGDTAIDLHWDILRPGRTRQPMAQTLLATRTDYGTHWGLSHGATLYLMLVHPVFRKYTTTPQASLMRLVDLLELLQQQPRSQQNATQLLFQSGLATAGWITLAWLQHLTGRRTDLMEEVAPGSIRRSYLTNWLQRDLANRLPAAVTQLAFTLAAHDTAKDALHAARRARHHRRNSTKQLAELQREIETTKREAS